MGIDLDSPETPGGLSLLGRIQYCCVGLGNNMGNNNNLQKGAQRVFLKVLSRDYDFISPKDVPSMDN
jgi:hypothetical protein